MFFWPETPVVFKQTFGLHTWLHCPQDYQSAQILWPGEPIFGHKTPAVFWAKILVYGIWGVFCLSTN